MISETQLDVYITQFQALIKRFIKSDSFGYFLQTQDDALTQRLVIELTTLLDEQFGENNIYSNNIIHTINTGSGGFMAGPSLAAIEKVIEIIKAAKTQMHREPTGKPKMHRPEPYVAATRIEDIKQLKSDAFDFSKLVALCEELNHADSGDCFMSVAMLVRAIIDHIPPTLGFRTFAEVANNYKGSSSFKKQLNHLDISLREVANTHLHVPIRKKEVCPSRQQVDFRSDLDVLLAEICRRSQT